MQHLFSKFTRRMASRVNGDCPAANLRDKPLLAILAQSRYVLPYITWNEFTSCRNAYAEMILWRDSFSAKNARSRKISDSRAVELFSFLRANGLTFYSTNKSGS